MTGTIEGADSVPTDLDGWKLIGYRNLSAPNGLRRFMTVAQYSKQTDGIKKWYEPVYCAPVPEGFQLLPIQPASKVKPGCKGYRTYEGDYECGYRTTLACDECKYSASGGRKDPAAKRNQPQD